MKKYHWTNTGKRKDNKIEFYDHYSYAVFKHKFGLDVDSIGEPISMDCVGASLQRIFEHGGDLFLCATDEDSGIVAVWIADGAIIDLDGYVYELE